MSLELWQDLELLPLFDERDGFEDKNSGYGSIVVVLFLLQSYPGCSYEQMMLILKTTCVAVISSCKSTDKLGSQMPQVWLSNDPVQSRGLFEICQN